MQKKYIVLISILVIYVTLSMIIFVFMDSYPFSKMYIMIDKNTRWEYKDKKWETVSTEDDIFIKNKFKIFSNQNYQGEFFIQNYENEWYFFDDNNKSYNLEGKLFAYYGDNDINVIPFNSEEPTIQEVNNLLAKYDIKINNLEELSLVQKVTIDLDKDEENEQIYSLSNMMSEFENSKTFSLVIYIDNDKEKTIMKNITDSSIDDINYIYSVSNIIDLNNDDKYEIIIEQQRPLNAGLDCHSMYKLKRGKYVAIKSCE